jgi:hypothetical protein
MRDRPFDRIRRVRGEAAHRYDHRLERLMARLPGRWRRVACWLRRPSARWARIPVGVLLILGGLLSILPLLGLWMLPLGLLLLAEDVPALRRSRTRLLEWAERRWPHWFAVDDSITAAAPTRTASHRTARVPSGKSNIDDGETT